MCNGGGRGTKLPQQAKRLARGIKPGENVRSADCANRRWKHRLFNRLFGHISREEYTSVFCTSCVRFIATSRLLQNRRENISAINRRIRRLEEDKKYIDLRSNLTQTTQSAQDALSIAKIQLKEAKDKRELLRKTGQLDAKEEADLIRESQFQKAEYKRLERS